MSPASGDCKIRARAMFFQVSIQLMSPASGDYIININKRRQAMN